MENTKSPSIENIVKAKELFEKAEVPADYGRFIYDVEQGWVEYLSSKEFTIHDLYSLYGLDRKKKGA